MGVKKIKAKYALRDKNEACNMKIKFSTYNYIYIYIRNQCEITKEVKKKRS